MMYKVGWLSTPNTLLNLASLLYPYVSCSLEVDFRGFESGITHSYGLKGTQSCAKTEIERFHQPRPLISGIAF